MKSEVLLDSATEKTVGGIGPTLANRYQMTKVLGSSNFSQVFLAQDRELGRPVVIKYLNLSTKFEYVQRFRREARLMAALKHPNIVQLFDFGIDVDRLYIIMEYVQGHELDAYYSNMQVPDGQQKIRRLCATVRELCQGLEYLHAQGIMHRDIKPNNILMDHSGKPYLIDFGIARRVTGNENVTVDGEILGTVAYMSPEQADGRNDEIDRRTDVYAVGVMMYHLLTGLLPFTGNSYDEIIDQIMEKEPPAPSTYNAEISPALDRIILRAIAKDKNQRFASAMELFKALEQIPSPSGSRLVAMYHRAKAPLALGLNLVAIALIAWKMWGPISIAPVDAAEAPKAEAKFLFRESFDTGYLAPHFVSVDGETGVSDQSLILRRGAVRTAMAVSPSDDFYLEIQAAVDEKEQPREMCVSLGGVKVAWDANSAGRIEIDGKRHVTFWFTPLSSRARKIVIQKTGDRLAIRDGRSTVYEGLFPVHSEGNIHIASAGGTMLIESVRLEVR